jgi:Mg2+/Co2+ transporter CorB
MDPDSWPIFTALVATILFSGFSSAIEMSFNALNRVRIKNSAEDGDKNARRVLDILSRFEEALTTILIVNNVLNIASASLMTVLVTRLWGSGAVIWGTIALTVVVYIFARNAAQDRRAPEGGPVRAEDFGNAPNADARAEAVLLFVHQSGAR